MSLKTTNQCHLFFGNHWSLKLLVFLASFLFGNLFGLNFSGIAWNINLIFLIALVLEILNFFLYNFLATAPKTEFLEKRKGQTTLKNFGFLNRVWLFQKISFFEPKQSFLKSNDTKNSFGDKKRIFLSESMTKKGFLSQTLFFKKTPPDFLGLNSIQNSNFVTLQQLVKFSLECFRRGFLVGIFIEAFKVGS